MRLLTLMGGVLATALSAPLSAQTLSAPEATILPRLIDSLCIDIHPATGCEQVILLTGPEDTETADLIILGDRRDPDHGAVPLFVLREAVFDGSLWGMAPSLEDGQARSLLLHSEQSGIGPHPWFQTLRIDWRDGAFHVTGYSYSTYDRLTASSFTCDVDYAAGSYRADYVLNDPETEAEQAVADSGATDPEPVALSLWHAFAPMPEICSRHWNRYFNLLP